MLWLRLFWARVSNLPLCGTFSAKITSINQSRVRDRRACPITHRSHGFGSLRILLPQRIDQRAVKDKDQREHHTHYALSGGEKGNSG